MTQFYFGTDPCFAGDPARNLAKDPLVRNPDLIRHGDTKSANPIKTVPSDKARYRQLTFSRNGPLLAGVAMDGKIKFWDTDSAALWHTLPGHNAITRSLGFSRDSKLLASSGDDCQGRV